jgi:hypothetical protein
LAVFRMQREAGEAKHTTTRRRLTVSSFVVLVCLLPLPVRSAIRGVRPRVSLTSLVSRQKIWKAYCGR